MRDRAVSDQRHGIVRRPRLERVLDDTSSRVILIHGPPGFGKTTLARQWLETREASYVWYACKPGASDVSSLAAGLADSLSKATNGFGAQLTKRLRKTPAQVAEPEALARIVAEEFCAASGIEWLVLDDYEALTNASASEDFIEALLSVDDRLRALVLTRDVPRWASARRVIYGEIFVIDASDLAMTQDEALDVLAGVDHSQVAARLAAADGWPAVVNLLARTPEVRIRRGAALRHFIGEEVCRGLTPAVVDVLAIFTALPRLSLRRAERIAGTQLARQAVQQAAERGIIVTSGRGVLEIHAAMRTYFDEHVRHRPPTERLRRMVRSAGQQMIDDAAWHDAFSLAERFDDLTLFRRTVRAGLSHVLDEGSTAAVEAWVAFGRIHNLADPELTEAEAELALRSGLYLRAETLATTVVGNDATSQRLAVRALITAGRAAHLGGHEESALAHYHAARTRAREPRDRREAAWGELAAATDLELDSARTLLGRLRKTRRQGPDDQVRLACRELLLGTRFGTFAPLEAARRVVQLVDLVDDAYLRTAFRNVYAYVSAQVGAYDDAEEEVEHLADDAERVNLTFVHPYVCLTRALMASAFHDFDRAFIELDRACDEARTTDRYVIACAAAIRSRALTALSYFADALDFASLDADAVTRSMRGELLATKAVALACLKENAKALEVAASATGTSSTVEVVFFADAARALVAMNGGDAATATALASRAREMSYYDGVLTVMRASPELGQAMSRDERHREWLRRVLNDVGDSATAASIGLTEPEPRRPALTPRETEVLSLLPQGLTNRQIGDLLYITEATVKSHVHRIYEKVGARNRAEAVAKMAL